MPGTPAVGDLTPLLTSEDTHLHSGRHMHLIKNKLVEKRNFFFVMCGHVCARERTSHCEEKLENLQITNVNAKTDLNNKLGPTE